VTKKKLITFIFLILLSIQACQKNPEMQENPKKETSKFLSEIQSEACTAAHDAGTCDTRLAEIGIVLKEDCCEVMGKCC